MHLHSLCQWAANDSRITRYSFSPSSTMLSVARSLTSTPSMPELLNFQTSSGDYVNIPQEMKRHYSALGRELLNDDTGEITSKIVGQHHTDTNQEILKQWLQGKGKPVTWCTLIGVLKNINSELAQIIQEGLIRAQIQEQEKWQQQIETHKENLHEKEKKIKKLQQDIREKVTTVHVWSSMM